MLIAIKTKKYLGYLPKYKIVMNDEYRIYG